MPYVLAATPCPSKSTNQLVPLPTYRTVEVFMVSREDSGQLQAERVSAFGQRGGGGEAVWMPPGGGQWFFVRVMVGYEVGGRVNKGLGFYLGIIFSIVVFIIYLSLYFLFSLSFNYLFYMIVYKFWFKYLN